MDSAETEDTDSPGTRRSGRRRTQTSFFQSKTVPTASKPRSAENGERKRKPEPSSPDAEGSPEKKVKVEATEAASNNVDSNKRVTEVSPKPPRAIVPKAMPIIGERLTFIGKPVREFDHGYTSKKLVTLKGPNKLSLAPPFPTPAIQAAQSARTKVVTTPSGIKVHVVARNNRPIMTVNPGQLAPLRSVLHTGITGNNLSILQVRPSLTSLRGPGRPQVRRIQPEGTPCSRTVTVPVPRLPPPSLQDSRTLLPTVSCAPVNRPPALKAMGTVTDRVISIPNPSGKLPQLAKSVTAPSGKRFKTTSTPGMGIGVRVAPPVMSSKAATSHAYALLSVGPSQTVRTPVRQVPRTLVPVAKPYTAASPPVRCNISAGNYVISVDPSGGVINPVQQGSRSLIYLSKPNAMSNPPLSATYSVPSNPVVPRVTTHSNKPNETKATTKSTPVRSNPAAKLDPVKQWLISSDSSPSTNMNSVAARTAPGSGHQVSLSLAAVSNSNAVLTSSVLKQTRTATSVSPNAALVRDKANSSNRNINTSVPASTALCSTQEIKLEPAEVSEPSVESSLGPNGSFVPAHTVGPSVTAVKTEPTDFSESSKMFANDLPSQGSVAPVSETITFPYPVGSPIPSALLQQSITPSSTFPVPLSDRVSKPSTASCVSSSTVASRTVSFCSVSSSALAIANTPHLPAEKRKATLSSRAPVEPVTFVKTSDTSLIRLPAPVTAPPAIDKNIALPVSSGFQLRVLATNPTRPIITCTQPRGLGLGSIPVGTFLSASINSKVTPKPNVVMPHIRPAPTLVIPVPPNRNVSNVSVATLPQPAQVKSNVKLLIPVASIQGNNMVSSPVCAQPASQLTTATNIGLVPVTSLLSTSRLNRAQVPQGNANPLTFSNLLDSLSQSAKPSQIGHKPSQIGQAPMVLLQSRQSTTQTLQNTPEVHPAQNAPASKLRSLLDRVEIQVQQNKLASAFSETNPKSDSTHPMTVNQLLMLKSGLIEDPFCSKRRRVPNRVSKKRKHADTVKESDPTESTSLQAEAEIDSEPKYKKESSIKGSKDLKTLDESYETASADSVELSSDGEVKADLASNFQELPSANTAQVFKCVHAASESDSTSTNTAEVFECVNATSESGSTSTNTAAVFKCVDATSESGANEPTPSTKEGGTGLTMCKSVAEFISKIVSEKRKSYSTAKGSDLEAPYSENPVRSTFEVTAPNNGKACGSIMCCICGKGFLNAKSLRCHMKKSHRDWQQDSDFLDTFKKHVSSMRSASIAVKEDSIKVVEPPKHISKLEQNSECNGSNSPTETASNQCDLCQRKLVEKSSGTVDASAVCECSDEVVSKRTRSQSKTVRVKGPINNKEGKRVLPPSMVRKCFRKHRKTSSTKRSSNLNKLKRVATAKKRAIATSNGSGSKLKKDRAKSKIFYKVSVELFRKTVKGHSVFA